MFIYFWTSNAVCLLKEQSSDTTVYNKNATLYFLFTPLCSLELLKDFFGPNFIFSEQYSCTVKLAKIHNGTKVGFFEATNLFILTIL